MERRRSILKRDSGTCLYCGAKPNSDQLRLAHMIPRSRGGSDHDNNLVTSCNACCDDQGDNIAIPSRSCEADENADGWTTWRQWRDWKIMWTPNTAYLDYKTDGYPIEFTRIHALDWKEHVVSKAWPREKYADFCEGLTFARTLMRNPKLERARDQEH